MYALVPNATSIRQTFLARPGFPDWLSEVSDKNSALEELGEACPVGVERFWVQQLRKHRFLLPLLRFSLRDNDDMLRLASLVGLVALTVSVSAQGRYDCTAVNTDGSLGPNPALCQGLRSTGQDDPSTGSQGDGPAPVNGQCVRSASTGRYFCGYEGAACTSKSNCDNGRCQGGVCTGGFGASCSGNDANCLGFLYCYGPNFDGPYTCGGAGAFCQDPYAVNSGSSASQAMAKFNTYCQSGSCNFGTAACDAPARGTTTTPAATTPPAGPTSTPVTVSGGVTTTKVIAAPVTVTCGSTTVASNCRAGASRARSCCTSSTATCDEIYNANIANCQTVESGYYPCSSTSAADTEECCASIYSAYFGSGGSGGDACSA